MLCSRHCALLATTLGCLLLIGTALAPRDARPASDIGDLRTGLNVYQGQLYSSTNSGVEGIGMNIQVIKKTGKSFTASSTFGAMTGTVNASGKFKAQTAIVPVVARGPGALGGFESIKIKGQLSATGEAIIGTYSTKGPITDKGSCFFVVEFDP